MESAVHEDRAAGAADQPEEVVYVEGLVQFLVQVEAVEPLLFGPVLVADLMANTPFVSSLFETEGSLADVSSA